MDGYHYTRAYLSSMPEPALAHARRGAHWTFDSAAFLSLVQTLRERLSASAPTIYAPSFSHSTKDPVVDDIPIPPTSSVLIFEGNYLSLDLAPWNAAARLMDELWFVEVDFGVARRRLVARHVEAGISPDEEEAGRRADGNDLVNGEEIVRGRLEVQEVVKSVEDESWADPVPAVVGGGGEGDGEGT
jgi:pantothenate kinase